MSRGRLARIGIGLTVLIVVMAPACTRERPSTSLTLADVALAHPNFVWDSLPAGKFTLYTPRGGYAAARMSQYHDEVKAAMSHTLAMIGEPRYPAHLRMFVLGSRQEVESISGTPSNGWGDAPGMNAAVVARAECRPVFRHEVMHAVSLLTWGHPLGADGDPHPPEDRLLFDQGGWLREGLAAAAEDLYGTYSYRGMAAQWQAEGTLLPLDTLVNAFYRQDDLAAYLQAGSLVQYLLEQHGHQRFRRVWRDGPRAFEHAYGKSSSQIEDEWQAWLRATPVSVRPRSIAVARGEDHCPKRPK